MPDKWGNVDEQSAVGCTFDTLADILSHVGGLAFLIEGIWTGARHGDLLGLKGVPFFVPLCMEWPEGIIVRLLKRYGIEVYGYCVANGEQFFYVDHEDASRTQAVLTAYSVPTVEPGENIEWKT